MSGGYDRFSNDQVEQLLSRVERMQRRLDELERPTGTQVAETVANQIVTDVASASVSSVSVGTSFTTILSVTIPVPAGFSRASVVAVGAWTASNTVTGWSGGDRAYLRMVIGGTAGPESNILLQTSMITQPVTATSTRVFSVTPGGSLVVQAQARNRDSATDAATWANANMSALALFTR